MSRRPNHRGNLKLAPWAPILLIAIGVSLGAGSLLGCTARRPAAAVATQTPSATAIPLPPTQTPTTPPTATAVPTSTASPTPPAPQVAQTQIAIVHSNDTWGYTLPCG